jgi:phosphoglycolate phosphatase-like HAD superfamily hydrolase
MDADPEWGPGVFALKVFEGPDRLAQVRSVLEELHSNQVECVVLSRGMVQTIRKILEQVELLPFFSEILGSEGCALGCTAYDHSVAAKERTPEREQPLDIDPPHTRNCRLPGLMSSKVDRLRELMMGRRLCFDEVVFVDDELAEIEQARCVCNTIHISSGMGMQASDMEALRAMQTQATCST